MCSELVPMSMAAMRMRFGLHGASAIIAGCRSDPIYIMPGSTARHDLLHARVRTLYTDVTRSRGRRRPRVHRTRVASRRLREVLPVLQLGSRGVRKAQPPPAQSHAAARARFASSTSLLTLIDELAGSALPTTALARVGRLVADERDRGAALDSPRSGLLPSSHGWPANSRRSLGALEAEDAVTAASPTAARSWQWAIDARAVHRATATRGRHRRCRRRVPARTAARGPHRREEAALRARAVGGRGPRQVDARPAAAATGAGHPRTSARSAGPHRSRPPAAGVVDAARCRRVAELDALVVSLEDECRRLHGRYMRERDGLVALCTRLAGQGDVRSQKAEASSDAVKAASTRIRTS